MQEDATFTDDSPVIRLFKALANPVRATIIHRLTRCSADVTELVGLTGASQPLVSHHLKVLREAHLVEARRDGRRQTYSIIDEHVAHIVLDAVNHTKEHDHDCHH